MNKNIFTKKELLFIKDYCLDMLNLFDEEDMIEKNNSIFLNNIENFLIYRNEIIDPIKKVDSCI